MELNDSEKKIVSYLKRGDKKLIATSLGVHVNTVSCVLRGKWENEAIWKEALKIVEKRNQFLVKKEQLANSLK